MSISTSKKYKSDLEIAQNSIMKHISQIAQNVKLAEEDYDLYGKYKAKVSLNVLEKLKNQQELNH